MEVAAGLVRTGNGWHWFQRLEVACLFQDGEPLATLRVNFDPDTAQPCLIARYTQDPDEDHMTYYPAGMDMETVMNEVERIALLRRQVIGDLAACASCRPQASAICKPQSEALKDVVVVREGEARRFA
jgi:hypothetical protein